MRELSCPVSTVIIIIIILSRLVVSRCTAFGTCLRLRIGATASGTIASLHHTHRTLLHGNSSSRFPLHRDELIRHIILDGCPMIRSKNLIHAGAYHIWFFGLRFDILYGEYQYDEENDDYFRCHRLNCTLHFDSVSCDNLEVLMCDH